MSPREVRGSLLHVVRHYLYNVDYLNLLKYGIQPPICSHEYKELLRCIWKEEGMKTSCVVSQLFIHFIFLIYFFPSEFLFFFFKVTFVYEIQ